jgi:hypothetical protein
MLQLPLSREEQRELLDVLEYDLKELRNEIANTENWKFKEGLKKREALLKKVMDHLNTETSRWAGGD